MSSGKIEIGLEGDAAFTRPASYLGGSFSAYLTATKGAGFSYSAQRKWQQGPRSKVAECAAALQAHGFDVVFLDGAENLLQAQVEQAQALLDVIQEQVKSRVAACEVTPYPFQRDGLFWLTEQLRTKGSALLADDMGLGKTLQALLAVPEDAAVVVVCPASLKGNWHRETARFRPDFTVSVLSGRKSFRWPASGEVIITNFDILQGLDTAGGAPDNLCVLVDEAHQLKNYKAARTQRVSTLVSAALDGGGWALGMTGTPLVNRPMELWSVLRLFRLHQRAFGSWNGFLRAFHMEASPHGGYVSNGVEPTVPDMLRGVMLHRRKVDVLKDLPAKRYQDIPVPVGAAVRKNMDSMLATVRATFLGQGGEPMNYFTEAGITFEDVSRLRMQLAVEMVPAMLEQVVEFEEAGEPLVVFSAHKFPVEQLGELEGWACITGETPAETRTELVDAFQRGELRGLALTIRAGGVGLTLTRAAHALFVDLDWTPAGNTQAEDRICRIGQDRPVLIRRLVADHELAYRVLEILATKEDLITDSITAAASVDGTAPSALEGLASFDVGSASIQAPAPAEAPAEAPAGGSGAPATEQDQKNWSDLVAKIPEGSYALRSAKDGVVRFYHISKPTVGRWRGWAFLSQLIGGSSSEIARMTAAGWVRGASGLDVLQQLAEDPLGASRLYGMEVGVCGACGSRLTNEESRAFGIGPVCRNKFGG